MDSRPLRPHHPRCFINHRRDEWKWWRPTARHRRTSFLLRRICPIHGGSHNRNTQSLTTHGPTTATGGLDGRRTDLWGHLRRDPRRRAARAFPLLPGSHPAIRRSTVQPQHRQQRAVFATAPVPAKVQPHHPPPQMQPSALLRRRRTAPQRQERRPPELEFFFSDFCFGISQIFFVVKKNLIFSENYGGQKRISKFVRARLVSGIKSQDQKNNKFMAEIGLGRNWYYMKLGVILLITRFEWKSVILCSWF